MTEVTLIFITGLTILTLISSSTSTSHHRHTHILDVSASLHLTRQVFEPSPFPQTRLSITSYNNHSNSFSFALHPRATLPSNLVDYNNNYTALMLSRLARDEERILQIMSTRCARARSSSSSSGRPEQLEAPLFSGLSQGSGEYFARVGLGQPARQFFMVIDSGSDVNWLQCTPCHNCYQQSDPVFDPRYSSTYRPLPCGSRQCALLRDSGCLSGTCLYGVSYSDGSYTTGPFATETVSFGTSGSIPGVAIGCGTDNRGLYAGAAGLLGLGGGPLSLPSQIKATSFSYCLVNRDSRSYSTLDFDSSRPNDSVVAPMVTNPRDSTFRYVALTGITVGGRPVGFPAGIFGLGSDGSGGVIVDSGTAVTRFRTEVYGPLRNAFASMTRGLPRAAGFSLFDTCYDLSGRASVRVPTVSFQFCGGKTLTLAPENYLIPVDDEGTLCFAFAGTSDSMSIIGNVQQQGTRVSYDLVNKIIAFSPNKC